MPDLHMRVGPRHLHELFAPIQPDWFVPQAPKHQQVATRTTAEIEDLVCAWPSDRGKQSLDVLRNIVIHGSVAELASMTLIVSDGSTAGLIKHSPFIVQAQQ